MPSTYTISSIACSCSSCSSSSASPSPAFNMKHLEHHATPMPSSPSSVAHHQQDLHPKEQEEEEIAQISRERSITTRLEAIEQTQRTYYAQLLSLLPKSYIKWQECMQCRREMEKLNCTDHESTIFLMDWDDTCFATSWLIRQEGMGVNGFVEEGEVASRCTNSPNNLATSSSTCTSTTTTSSSNKTGGARDERLVEKQLHQLEQNVLSLLKRALSKGKLIIVTNSGQGWVEQSSLLYLPSVYHFLRSSHHNPHLKIISARERYEKYFGNIYYEWKNHTFYEELMNTELIYPLRENTKRKSRRNIVVVGDSAMDKWAALQACSRVEKKGFGCLLKVVKFLEQPDIEVLSKEVAVLLRYWDEVVGCGEGFEVAMLRKDCGGVGEVVVDGGRGVERGVEGVRPS